MQRILLILLLWCLFPVVSHATTRYVANGGSGNCTTGQNIATPLGTIAAGVNCSSSSTGGDILYLRAGTYSEHVANSGSNTVNWPRGTSWSAGGYFLMASYPGETATLLGQIDIHPNNTSNGINPAYIQFDRMKFTMGSTGDAPGTVGEVPFYVSGVDHLKVTNSELCCANNQIIETDGADHTFQNNNIHHANVFLDLGIWQNCHGSSSWFAPCAVGAYCFYGHPHDSLFENNSWHECTGIAIHFYHGCSNPPCDPHEIRNNVVRNNIFYNNSTTDGDRGTGISVFIAWTGENNLIYNNIFYNNFQGYSNASGVLSDQNIGDQIYNNTFYNNSSYPIYLYPGSTTAIVKDNIFWANSPDAILLSPGAGHTTTCPGFPTCNLTSNPSFVNVGAPDFHLQSGSAAIDTAQCLPGIVDVDKDGVSRPRGAGCDIGAYELAGVPPPTRLRFTIQPQTTPATQTMAAVAVQAEDASGNIASAFTGNVTIALVSAVSLITQTAWTVLFADSFEPDTSFANWAPVSAIDGNSATAWHTRFSGTPPPPPLPHEIQIDLHATYPIAGFRYLPRQGADHSGQITGYAFYTSTDGVTWGTAAATGTFSAADVTEKEVLFTARDGRYVRLVATGSSDGTYASMAELNVLQTAGTGTGVLSGTLIRAAVGGVATFDTLAVSAGGIYQLQVTTAGLSPASSSAFTITSAANHLAFLGQPTTVLPGQTFPSITVQFLDGANNVFSTTQAVNMTLTGCAGATLAGTVSRAAVAGVATFNDLSIATAATGCTLVASATDMVPVTSSPFNIISNPFLITEWLADGVSGHYCAATGGDTHLSGATPGVDHVHTLACVIPANLLHAGDVLESCALVDVVSNGTGARPAVKLLFGGAVVATNLSAGVNATVATNGWICFQTLITQNPGPAVPLYSSFAFEPAGFPNYTNIPSLTAQPLTYNTTGSISLGFATQWATAGGGTNAITLHAMIVGLSR